VRRRTSQIHPDNVTAAPADVCQPCSTVAESNNSTYYAVAATTIRLRFDVLLVIHSDCGPISYPFRSKRRWRSKNANFSYAAAFNAPADGVNLEFGNAGWGQKLELLPFHWCKKFGDHLNTIAQRDGRTDRQTETPKQYRSSY